MNAKISLFYIDLMQKIIVNIRLKNRKNVNFVSLEIIDLLSVSGQILNQSFRNIVNLI
jgi:hypothetical protein